ncbi:hypothetical protein K0T92_14770 [Paenibacillus oenotherae]|uniref:Zinc ribbon domain-containing protein n=1 Tax=Paenibacillus oenotherae TaxID=1435645 RepID=A0ABS7D903_9BACL|nr:hypothetical protein [Paenibacillus oenotherae]MBW7476007.1 hypothetical protein [Paenibacillus oenotherae]
MIGSGMYPLVSLMSGLATAFVLLLAVSLLGAMIYIIRLTTDDSDKHSDLKMFIETLFTTPEHLRQGNADTDSGKHDSQHERPPSAKTPFSEPCPACQETVTHENTECPSCGLRLL